jgi:hypothetical protein
MDIPRPGGKLIAFNKNNGAKYVRSNMLIKKPTVHLNTFTWAII